MTQGELEKIPQKVIDSISTLEMRIMTDIVRRVEENGFLSASDRWQISRLQQLSEADDQIREWIQDFLQVADEAMEEIISEDVYREYYSHAPAYNLSRTKQIPFSENEALQQTIEAVKRQTQETFENLTGSMGFAKKNPATGKLEYSELGEFYRDTLDSAMYDIHSGAFDYNTVLNRTIKQMTDSGIRWVNYESGHRDRVDVAARRAIMTGFRQIQGQINDQVAEELHTDYFEVTAHVGARPTHQPWQGRVYSRQELIDVCGLGDVTGLKGINCYHDYRPFIPGVSTRTYTDEQLEEMIREENTPKEYNGKQYTTYEALQQQRAMERAMRKTRQDIQLLKEGGASDQEIMLRKAKYQGQYQTYKDFSEKMDLPTQMERVYQDGLTGNFNLTKKETKALEEMKGSSTLNTYEDPIREKIGSAFESHPEETNAIIKEVESKGVTVVYRDNVMGYEPNPTPGTGGQLVMDKKASYSAWLHERQHVCDDEASGWQGFRIFMDPEKAVEFETRAYDVEIDFAKSLGYNDIVKRLEKLKNNAIENLRAPK